MQKRSADNLKRNYLSISRRILFVTIIDGLVFFILLQVQSSRRIKKTVLRNWHSSMPFIRSTRIKLCWRTPRWSTIFNTSLRTILSEHRRKVCFRYIFHDLSPKNCINILYSKYYAFTFKDYGKRNIISSIFFQFNNFSI